ncbi:MAG TPA: Do family serine endopeptidase [Syntrophorhabdaceae bacterium]|jgi:serine protease Do
MGRIGIRVDARRLSLSLFILLCAAGIVVLGSPAEGKAAKTFDLSTAIVQVAKKAIPGVVHIEVTGTRDMPGQFTPFESDPFFRYFFGTPKSPKKFKREIRGLGTGMIIDAQGHILTNYHVVGGASKLEVLLTNGRKYTAKLVGTDPKTDLAVIRISPGEQLPFLAFGDSDKMEVGEWVVAIGHPRGLDQTVTQGIISATHRTGITDPSSYQDFLQTDAAINPGNSGGPLLNLQGEVIGVNAVILSESGGYEGIGFAIPSNIASHVAKLLITYGKVERGWLGIAIQDLSGEKAKAAGLESPKGVMIDSVTKGGPAEKSGLKKGDIITAFEGRAVPDSNSFRNSIANMIVGSTAKITVLRAGKKQVIAVRIGNLREELKSLASAAKQRLGAEVRLMSPKEADRYGLTGAQGISLTWIDPNGPLGKAGFEVGDMIAEVNGQPFTGLETFLELIAGLQPKQQITLLAIDRRTGNTGQVQVVVK